MASEPSQYELQEDESIWACWVHLWEPQETLSESVLARPGMSFDKALQEAGEFRAVLQLLGDEYPEIVRARESTSVQWSREQTKDLMQAVRAKARPKTSFSAQRRVLEIIEVGNNNGLWRIPIVDVPAPLPPPPKPVFSHEGFEQAVRYQELPQIFVRTLRVDDTLEPRAIWGQVLLSSLLFGGLLRPASLWGFGDAIPDAPAHLRWVEWPVEEAGGGHRVRRHFVDPLTRLLVLQWRKRGWPPRPCTRKTPQLFRAMRKYAEEAGFDSDLPGDWSTLHQVVETRLALYVPPHLIGVSTGFYHPTSLPLHTVDRLTGELGPVQSAVTEPAASAETLQGRSSTELTGSCEKADSESATGGWPETVAADIRQIGSILRNSVPDQREKLRAWTDDPGRLASIRRLAQWARDGLLKGGHGHTARSSKTAYERFNAIAERLVGQLADDDPVGLERDDLVEIYVNAIEDTDSLGARKRVLKGMQEFQAYLERHHDVPGLADGDLFIVRGQQPIAVDANFIEPENLEWALTWLQVSRDEDPETPDVSALMAILGYYAGLRRSEVTGLRLGDLKGEPGWDLVIEPYSLRRLKSQSAARVAPLSGLLPSEHLRSLEQWWCMQRQAAEEVGEDWRDCLLFDPIRPAGANSEASTSRPTEQQRKEWVRRGGSYMKRIREALYRVTGDPGLRFHHLRHSFANRMLLLMWQAECEHAEDSMQHPGGGDVLNEPIPGWARSWIGQESWPIRSKLLGHSSAQRRSLMAIARMLGHSSPGITMGHYIHLADLVLSTAVRRLTPSLSETTLMDLADCTSDDIRRWRRQVCSRRSSDLLDHAGDQLLPPEQRLRPRKPQSHRTLAMPEQRVEVAWLLTKVLNGRSQGAGWLKAFRPPWSDETLEHWEQVLQTLPPYLKTSRYGGNRMRPIEFPDTQQDIGRARHTMEWLEQRPEAEQTALIEAYRTGRLERNPVDIALPSPTLAVTWHDLIQHLDLGDAIDFYVVPAHHEPTSERNREIALWREQTGMDLIFDPHFSELPAKLQNEGEGGAVLCCHRKGAGDRRGYWVYGVQWSFLMAWLLRQ